MKKTILLLLFPFVLAGQIDSSNEIQIISTDIGIFYINSNSRSNYIIKFEGDSVKQCENSSFIDVDGRNIAITDYSYFPSEYINKDGEEKLKELLNKKMEYEKEYFEKEIYDSKLKIEKNFLKNSENKLFLFWGYEVPSKKRKEWIKKMDLVESPVYNSFLFFISNGVVVGIHIPSMNIENVKKDQAYLKLVAENIDVFGGPINKEAFYYKLNAQSENKRMIYTDSVYNFEIDLPEWVNISHAGENFVFAGTLPDINNNCNAIFISAEDKNKFGSFEEFNNRYVKGNVVGSKALFNENLIWMGHNELKKPEECNGISYRIFYFNNESMYHCWFCTYETKTAYLLVRFISTQDTFDLNKNKFSEFLSRLKINYY